MAENALDVVPLDAVKAEFRLGDTTEKDEMLVAQIGAAVSFVEQSISIPLIDRAETFHVHPPPGERPAVVRTRAVKSLDRVRYWMPGTGAWADPDGEIPPGDLGRRAAFGARYAVYPGPAGWPAVEPGTLLVIELTRALDVSRTRRVEEGGDNVVKPGRNEALYSAVVLCVRQLFDGYREIRPTEAFYALLAPYRRYD
ncbi:hypothetical protein [Candidatus Palauibacter sp.]|uniref:hypothetical protein n=1 Tax=Candidatus Palauibacter sp. TaxID=3101350 RepID=UPI003CC5AE7D